MFLLKKINELFHSLSFYKLLGILCLFFIGYTIYISLFDNYLYVLLSFVISGLISFYVLDKFNYSEFVIIRLLQRALYLSILTIFGLFIYFVVANFFGLIPIIECSNIDESIKASNTSIVNNASNFKDVISVIESTSTIPNKSTYEFKIDKEVVDNVIKNGISTVNTFVEKILPNIGAGAAAGTVGAAVVKATANAPLGGRILAIGASTGITAISTQTGLNIGLAMTRNLDLDNLVKDSPHVTIDRIPSPDPFFVPSILENTGIDSPLEVLINSQLTLNILI